MATAIQEHIALSPGMNEATTALAERLRAATVEVRGHGHGHGSGVIWRQDGLIVTNHHVAHGAAIEVVLADGRVFPARVTAREPERDLAALRVEARDLPAAAIGDSAGLRVGQLVVAVGHPLGIKGAASVGIIHAIGAEHVRADLSLLPGNSGGPLADAEGRVIGINSMVAGGLALAVPSNAVTRFLGGQGATAFLGVMTQPVTFPPGQGWAGQEGGLLVLTVVEGGPAARNGLLPGDILLTAGGRALRAPDDLPAVLRESAGGTPLPLLISRGGRRLEVTAILGARETVTP